MQLRFAEAINQALREEMAEDERVVLLGEDVGVGLMGATRGLLDEFGTERVLDMPISEAGFTGMAIGMAIDGLRPVIEFQITSLPYVAWDQIVNQAMKMRYMMGGQVRVPITCRVVASGATGGGAGQHSDHIYPMLLNAGVKVVVPATPSDAKGLLKSAIRDDDPVFVFESARLFGTKGEVPETSEVVPLGTAAVRRVGADVTIVAVGYLVAQALHAADELARVGIDAEVVDPRTLWPLDVPTIIESVAKTRRLVVADDANRVCGFAGELMAVVCEQMGTHLRSAPKRVTRSGFVMPFARGLSAELMPMATHIDAAARAVMADAAQRPVDSTRQAHA